MNQIKIQVVIGLVVSDAETEKDASPEPEKTAGFAEMAVVPRHADLFTGGERPKISER